MPGERFPAIDADDALRLYVLGLIDADLDTAAPDTTISTRTQAPSGG